MSIRSFVMASLVSMVLGGCSFSMGGAPMSSTPGYGYSGYDWSSNAGKPVYPIASNQSDSRGKPINPSSSTPHRDPPPVAKPTTPPQRTKPTAPPVRKKPAPHRTKPVQPTDPAPTRPIPTPTPRPHRTVDHKDTGHTVQLIPHRVQFQKPQPQQPQTRVVVSQALPTTKSRVHKSVR